MKTSTWLMAVVFAGALWSVDAWAHGGPCCETYDPCTGAEYVKKNAAPEDAQCCALVDHDNDPNTDPVEECRAEPNAGYRCEEDVMTNTEALPDRQAIAGCVQDDASETEACIGGAITAGGPAGCAWVLGNGVVGSAQSTDADACTASAVANCCANGACI